MAKHPDTLASLQFTGEEKYEQTDASIATGVVAAHTTVAIGPSIHRDDYGFARRRPAGEPGSLAGVELRETSERPDDN